MVRMFTIGVLSAALGFLGATSASADLSFQAYEVWKGAGGVPNMLIRSDRWVGTDFGAQEVTREIRLNPAGVPYLYLHTRQEGQTTDNNGSTFFASNGLRFRNPEKVSRVQAIFKVNQVHVDTHCVANTTRTTEAQAEVYWVGFNDGSSTGPGDRTGDHKFELRASRTANSSDAAGALRVRASICRCLNASCGSQDCRFGQLPTALTISRFTLEAIHDPNGAADAKFLFNAVELGPQQKLGYPASTPLNPVLDPAVDNFGYLNAGGQAVNCTVQAGGPKEFEVLMQLLKVKTNPEAVTP